MPRTTGWTVQIVATPSALDFIDVPELEQQTGRPVRSQYRKPHEPKPPRADAIIVAPATYNTINKFAQGIADTYALGLLAEAPGLGIPVVVLPFVNRRLSVPRTLSPKRRKLARRRHPVLLGPGQFEPHPSGIGEEQLDTYPWALALKEIGRHHPR